MDHPLQIQNCPQNIFPHRILTKTSKISQRSQQITILQLKKNTKYLNMQLRQICFYGLIITLVLSSAYLCYLTSTQNLPMIYKLRCANFILEHILGIVMVIKRKFYCFDEDTCGYLLWMIGFTGINFLNFAGIELYGIINGGFSSQPKLEGLNVSFVVLSYFHLYYQINIYLGVFCLFSVAMGIIYYINHRRHSEEVEEVLDELQSEKYQENQRQQNCSICLTDFQKSQKVYKLVCGHTFHKDCLKDWFKQKLSCPMCRDDVARGIHQRDQNRQLNEQPDSYQHQNWQYWGGPPVQYYHNPNHFQQNPQQQYHPNQLNNNQFNY